MPFPVALFPTVLCPVALFPIVLFALVPSKRAFARVLFPVLLLRVAPCQVRLPKTARYS